MITFEQSNGQFLFIKFGGMSCHWRGLRGHNFNSAAFTIPKWRTSRLLRWMQNLHLSTWVHEVLFSGKSLKDEELLIWPFLWETKKTNLEVLWKLKLIFYLMETTHEQLHLLLDKWSLVQWKIIDIPINCIWTIAYGAKFWGFVGTNAEPLCAELCNFMQFCIFIHNLTC
jgi:hypothetical protein